MPTPYPDVLLGQFCNDAPVFVADKVPFVAIGYDAAWKFYQGQKPLLEKTLMARGCATSWRGRGRVSTPGRR